MVYLEDMKTTDTTPWTVLFSRKAAKQKGKLAKNIADILYLLEKDLELRGPTVFGWPHYSKIVGTKSRHHHCHLNKGHPTYVVVWQVVDDVVHILEIQFVGTHEKVDYSRFK